MFPSLWPINGKQMLRDPTNECFELMDRTSPVISMGLCTPSPLQDQHRTQFDVPWHHSIIQKIHLQKLWHKPCPSWLTFLTTNYFSNWPNGNKKRGTNLCELFWRVNSLHNKNSTAKGFVNLKWLCPSSDLEEIFTKNHNCGRKYRMTTKHLS